MKRKKRAISYGTQVAILLVVFVGAVTIQNRTTESAVTEPVLQSVSATEVVVEELKGEVAEKIEELPVIEEVIEPVEKETTYVQYIVQQGDTLAKICRERYGSDEMVSEICALNDITNGDYIQIGEIILLP